MKSPPPVYDEAVWDVVEIAIKITTKVYDEAVVDGPY